MSGRAWEYMMSVVVDINDKPLSGRHNAGNSGFKGVYGCTKCDRTLSGIDSSIIDNKSGLYFPVEESYFDTYVNSSV